ncbi:hypothetical protein RRF57_013274 [Xylaria bambusicola]|uniref:Uncharacterized protein n=1 Tax=Xylaria bambusicola TaxID=326684 RepID=A0AAN7V543_9PEZI
MVTMLLRRTLKRLADKKLEELPFTTVKRIKLTGLKTGNPKVEVCGAKGYDEVLLEKADSGISVPFPPIIAGEAFTGLVELLAA